MQLVAHKNGLSLLLGIKLIDLKNIRTAIFLLVMLSLALQQACVPSKNLLYPQAAVDGPDKDDFANIMTSRTIQPNDELYIKVFSTDEQTARILSRESDNRNFFDLNLLSYRVEEDGTIDFPFVGKIYLKGLSLDEARSRIVKELKPYLSNTSVLLKFVNNKVTVLGEVNKPGDYDYYNEKITIFRALGLGGGIAEYGDKSNVILIREEDNGVSYHYLDLTKKEIVRSDYFYLEPNDVLIVNPIKSKFWSMTSFNWGTLLTSISTLLAIMYYFKP